MPRQPNDRSIIARVLIAAALALLPFIFFHSAFTGDVILAPGDGWTQNFGVRVLIGQMIAAGEWPLWNPYIFGGTPLLASIYPGAIYPPNWLFAIFKPATAMNLVVVTTYHIALIGTYLFARRIGNTRAASLIAAMSFAFGGYLVSHLGHTSRIAAAAWLPWIMLAVEELYLEARWRWVVLGSFFIALQLFAGEPQMNCYTLILAALYWIFSLAGRNVVPSTRRRFVFASMSMAIGGALFSMLQYQPSRELLNLGERAKIPFEYFAGGSLPPSHIFTFVFPFFFGGGLQAPFLVGSWGREGLVETSGYVGLLTLLLCFAAMWRLPSNRMIAFWAGATLLSLLLAFGTYLPFQIDHLLHRLPVYGLFRVQARHMLEFTFCAGILAALGVTGFARSEWSTRRRTYVRAAAVFLVAVIATVLAYTVFGERFVTVTPRAAGSGLLFGAESIIPIGLAVASLVVVGLYAYRPAAWMAALLVLLLFVDLKTVSNSYEWRMAKRSATIDKMDSRSVDLIKQREGDLHAFRIASYSTRPFDQKYATLNYPNVSIARGLESINGYDALRLISFSQLAGDMTLEGLIQDKRVFGPDNKALDLLNVKYLLMDRAGPIDPASGLRIDGIQFEDGLFNVALTPQSPHIELQQRNVRAAVLALVTAMSNAGDLPDGLPIARVTVNDKNGKAFSGELLAGRDTSEWSLDRAEVKASIKHGRARIAESFDAGTFQAHRYITTVSFDLTEVKSISLDYLPVSGSLDIARASFYDHTTGVSTGVEQLNVDPARWRVLDSIDSIDVFERTKSFPRAWFVKRAAAMTREKVMASIKTGILPVGSAFDPAETVLFATEDFGGRELILPDIGDPAGSNVRITRYGAHRIELETRNQHPGFLVMSEIYYRGWEARIDGSRVPVERVDHTLRGVAVPPGEHRVEFVFLAHSFRSGAIYGGIGLLLLTLGGFWWRRNPGFQV